MNINNNEINKLSELILASLDDTISDEDFLLLNNLIASNGDVAQFYVDSVANYTALTQQGGISWNYPEEVPDSQTLLLAAIEQTQRDALIQDRLAAQKAAQQAYQEYLDNSKRTIKKVEIEKYRFDRRDIITMLSVFAACVMVIVSLQFGNKYESGVTDSDNIAVLVDMLDANWQPDINGLTPNLGDKLQSRELYLRSGLAKIQFTNGATILVQAPSRLKLESEDQIFLQNGKLTATIPPSAIGFTVRSNIASVVDYGTEFGVMVTGNDLFEAHTFKGEIEVRSGANPYVFQKSQRLLAGQAVITNNPEILIVSNSQAQRFVKNIDEASKARDIFNRNLIVNGDFEKGPVGKFVDEWPSDVEIFGWQDDGPATILAYRDSASYGFPTIGKHSLPINYGNNFFIGTDECVITQTIDISLINNILLNSEISYELSGWLGGFLDHDDAAELEIIFLDRNGFELKSASIGPIYAKDRNFQTGFLFREKTGIVPAQSETIILKLHSYQSSGVADAYADNLQLILKKTE